MWQLNFLKSILTLLSSHYNFILTPRLSYCTVSGKRGDGHDCVQDVVFANGPRLNTVCVFMRMAVAVIPRRDRPFAVYYNGVYRFPESAIHLRGPPRTGQRTH